MNDENTLLSHSNIANKDFDLSKISIKIVEQTDTYYSVVISIGNRDSQKWHIEIPTNIDFLKGILCNVPEKNVTKKEFKFYRKMMQVAYALSIYFIDIKNSLTTEVLSEEAFAGYDFYEYAEKLFIQIHAKITNIVGDSKL